MNNILDKKTHILSAGLEVMKHSGYNGTSVKDIVDAAGVPKGSFYNYFESKEIFAIEALEMAAMAGKEIAQKAFSNTQLSPLERLTGYFKDQASCLDEQGCITGCVIGNIGQEMADASESIRIKVRTLLRINHQLIEKCLEDAKSHGELNASLNTKQLAEFLFNYWEGALIAMKAEKKREPLDTFITLLPSLLAK